MIEVMKANNKLQNNASVGCFRYDINKKELFGVYSALADDIPFQKTNIFDQKVKNGRKLCKDIWEKQSFGHDSRFKGDYTLVPRGRVFQLEDKSFAVIVGDWIKDYPEATEIIIYEFDLPKDNTKFIINNHWNIGQNFADELI